MPSSRTSAATEPAPSAAAPRAAEPPATTCFQSARERSDSVDRTLLEAYTNALGRTGTCNPGGPGGQLNSFAVAALGGYGRRELSPQSDIDLLVLYAPRARARVEQSVRALLYPLWDAGYHVGHRVLTVREALRQSSADLDLTTAALDARVLAGDRALFERFQGELIKRLRSRGGTPFLRTLDDRQRRRRSDNGDTPCLLEPDVKDGCGGLRDIQAMVWASKVACDVSDLPGLRATDLLTEDEIASLKAAHEFLTCVRAFLHEQTGRPHDRLTFDAQETIAEALGYQDTDGLLAVERFMQDYYRHARNVDFLARMFWLSLQGESAAGLPQPGTAGPSLASALSMFAAAARSHAGAPVANLRRMNFASEEGRVEIDWDEAARADFLTILRAGTRADEILETMLHVGVLGGLVPEFAAVRCRPQFDTYHRYTVDTHSFHTVSELGRMATGEPDSLFLAGLLHDIGKRHGRSHAAAGAPIANAIVKKMGFPRETEREVAFLVRHHLLLPDTATRRDIDDEHLIVDLAGRIGTPDRLRMLYLLAIADGRSTGPSAWTPWKAALVQDLFFKVLHVLQRTSPGRNPGALARRKRGEFVRLLRPKYAADELGTFIDSLPVEYALAHEPTDMAGHFEIMRRTGPDKVGTGRSEVLPGVWSFAVVAPDSHGLFSKIAGVLSLHGMNILAARVYTSSEDRVLDVFRVTNYFEGGLDDDRWRLVEHDLGRVLESRISIDYRLDKKLRHYRDRPTPGPRAPAEVIVLNDASDFYTVIEVHAADRLGLLYRIAKAMTDLGLDLRLAKVSTNVDRVVDVFYVRDFRGEKVTDAEQLRDIEGAILLAIQQPAQPESLR